MRRLRLAGGVVLLKTRVRASLKAHRAMLAFDDAPSPDGGAGVVHVLLRNWRGCAIREREAVIEQRPACRRACPVQPQDVGRGTRRFSSSTQLRMT
jgi:hypothetical protein